MTTFKTDKLQFVDYSSHEIIDPRLAWLSTVKP